MQFIAALTFYIKTWKYLPNTWAIPSVVLPIIYLSVVYVLEHWAPLYGFTTGLLWVLSITDSKDNLESLTMPNYVFHDNIFKTVRVINEALTLDM